MQKGNGTALITGATSGIGLELAKRFAKDGYNLVIVARNQDELDRTAMELSLIHNQIQITPIAKDLFDTNAAHDVYQEVKTKGLIIDVLVNNAGQGIYGPFVETDLQKHVDIIQLNVTSLVVLTHLFLKEMVQRNSGKILQLGSVASRYPSPLQAVYGATKAFILQFSEALVNELKDTNITVTTLMPGGTDTDFFRKGGFEDTVLVRETKLSDPADVAKDGYEALMAGKDKVVSGLKNKAEVAMNNLITDAKAAELMRKQMEVSEKAK